MLEKIGEGGFASVYGAEQNEPVQRQVTAWHNEENSEALNLPSVENRGNEKVH